MSVRAHRRLPHRTVAACSDHDDGLSPIATHMMTPGSRPSTARRAYAAKQQNQTAKRLHALSPSSALISASSSSENSKTNGKSMISASEISIPSSCNALINDSQLSRGGEV